MKEANHDRTRTDEQITIFQMSDFHWTALKETKEGVDTARDVSEHCERVLRSLGQAASEFITEQNILILNGDMVNAGSKQEFVSYQEHVFHRIVDIFQPAKTIVVPGNHDVCRGADESARLQPFQEFAAPLVNPYGNPMHIADPYRFMFWAFNSSKRCQLACPEAKERLEIFEELEELIDADISDYPLAKRIREQLKCSKKLGDGSYIDDIGVDQEQQTQCAEKIQELSGMDNFFKIAVLHHNTLPFLGDQIRNNRNVSRFFRNASIFNQFLLENNFSLVLHGHQHTERETFFSIPTACFKQTDRGNNRFTGFNDLGFLSIGAPSMDIRNTPALNIIQISIRSDNAMATVELFNCSTQGQGGYDFRISQGTTYKIPFNRFSNLQNGKTRQAVQEEVNNRLFSRDPTKAMNLADHLKLNTASIKHFGKIDNFLRKVNEPECIYFLSVLPPERWNETGLKELCEPFSTTMTERAILCGPEAVSEMGPETATKGIRCFKFTHPLSTAIQTSNQNAKAISVTTHLQVAAQDAGFEDLSIPERQQILNFLGKRTPGSHNRNKSTSVWDNGQDLLAEERHMLAKPYTLVENTGKVATTNFVARAKQAEKYDISEAKEICRILLWPPEWFDKPETKEIVFFHERSNIPLFWLNPKRLRCDTNPRRFRKKIGYTCIIASQYIQSNEMFQAFESQNNSDGESPSDEDYHKQPSLDSPMRAAWGTNDGKLTSKNLLSPTNEFSYLLLRPDLMFASDVWSLRRTNLWHLVETQFTKIQPLCSRWPEEEL